MFGQNLRALYITPSGTFIHSPTCRFSTCCSKRAAASPRRVRRRVARVATPRGEPARLAIKKINAGVRPPGHRAREISALWTSVPPRRSGSRSVGCLSRPTASTKCTCPCEGLHGHRSTRSPTCRSRSPGGHGQYVGCTEILRALKYIRRLPYHRRHQARRILLLNGTPTSRRSGWRAWRPGGEPPVPIIVTVEAARAPEIKNSCTMIGAPSTI